MIVHERKACSARKVREANELALSLMTAGEPVLFDVQRALYAIPGMHTRMILHAGPPIQGRRMCPPMKVAIA